ncbi:hypothetical protein [Cupriavidus basilensis]
MATNPDTGRAEPAPLPELVLELFQRVQDEPPLDHAEHGAAQADCCGAGHRRAGSARFQQLPGAVVVKQYSPFDIADQHAQRELRHERGEPVLLLGQRAVRQCDPALHVVVHGLMGSRQQVKLVDEDAHVARALRRDAMARVGRKQHGVFGQARDRRQVSVEQRFQPDAQAEQQQQREGNP